MQNTEVERKAEESRKEKKEEEREKKREIEYLHFLTLTRLPEYLL